MIAVIDYAEKNDKFIKHSLSFEEIRNYYFSFIPFIASLITPITAFVSDETDFIEEMHFPILQGRKVIAGKATAFVCIDQTCIAPVHNANELKEQLKN